MKMKSSTPRQNSARGNKEATQLADFVLFPQRSCILRLSAELSKERLSYPQLFLLAFLAEEEGLSMSAIAGMMGHTTAAATGMVDKLQELGFTQRSTAMADRRKVLVKITDKGRDIVLAMRNNLATDIANTLASSDSVAPSLEGMQSLQDKKRKKQKAKPKANKTSPSTISPSKK